MPARPAPPPQPAPHSRREWLPFAILLAAGLFAWWGVWTFDYVFDDLPLIVDNASLHRPDVAAALADLPNAVLGSRPITWLSLRLDLALFGDGPFGHHLVNLLLHLANGCLLFACARGCLRSPTLRDAFDDGSATRTALALACVWIAHPLATDAVAYASQRSKLLASLFLLIAFVGVLRAATSPHRRRWQTVAVAALALGMGSKEDMVVAPLLVALLLRAFVVADWRSLRAHAGFLFACASTWLLLAVVVRWGTKNETVGFDLAQRITALEWLQTQAGVVVHYVRLAIWPSPLRGAYDGGIVRTLGPAVVPGAFLIALLALVVAAWRRRPAWGFVGALFFLLLAPTSTVLPIATEIVAERRAYLPMLLVLVPAVFGVRELLRRAFGPSATAAGIAATATAVVALGLASRAHAPHYANEPAFWQDCFDKRDPESRTMLAAQILSNHGAMLFRAGKGEEAAKLFEVAMQCESAGYVEFTNHAVVLHGRGEVEAAYALLERAIAQRPDYAQAHAALGTCLVMDCDRSPKGNTDPRLARAVAALERATQLTPTRVAAWNTLGAALQRQGRVAEAERAFLRATELPYERVEPFLARAQLLRQLGRVAEIAPMWNRLLGARPRDAALRMQLAMAAAQEGDRAVAIARLREVVALEPGNAQAVQALRQLESAQGK